MTSHINRSLTWCWITLALLAITVALLGGSSRPDAVQLVVLRPFVALFLLPIIYYLRWRHLCEAPALVLLLVAMAVWMALQLFPVPGFVWEALSERQRSENLDALTGVDEIWRPLSLAPARGWNALMSLIVPLAALLIALVMRARSRMLLMMIACMGLLNSLLGLLQILGGRSNPLYFYAVTNHGSPVGVFANENHSAVFSAVALLVLAYLFATSARAKEPVWLRYFFAPAFVVVLVSALMSSSRSGLAFSLLAAPISVVMVLMTNSVKRRSARKNSLSQWFALRPGIAAVALFAAVFLLVAAFFGFERSGAFRDLYTQSAFEDLRWRLWPVLKEMLAAHWMMGTGFGSFEDVYHIYEPTALLLPSYVNQAHNDWAQLAIEGGIPAIVLLFALLGWIGVALYRIVLQRNGLVRFLFWSSCFLIVCVASTVDYPLRTPVFQLCAVWLLLAMHLERRECDAV